MSKKPDKDMEQPKAYNPSIDPKKTQPGLNMDMKYKDYSPGKTIDYKHKLREYQPNNQYYKTSFWNASRRKMNPKPKMADTVKAAQTEAVKKPVKPLPIRQVMTQNKAATAFAAPTTARSLPETSAPVVEQAPPTAREHWGQARAVPVLAMAPALAAPRTKQPQPDFSMLPSSVGSMTRMLGMFS